MEIKHQPTKPYIGRYLQKYVQKWSSLYSSIDSCTVFSQKETVTVTSENVVSDTNAIWIHYMALWSKYMN